MKNISISYNEQTYDVKPYYRDNDIFYHYDDGTICDKNGFVYMVNEEGVVQNDTKVNITSYVDDNGDVYWKNNSNVLCDENGNFYDVDEDGEKYKLYEFITVGCEKQKIEINIHTENSKESSFFTITNNSDVINVKKKWNKIIVFIEKNNNKYNRELYFYIEHSVYNNSKRKINLIQLGEEYDLNINKSPKQDEIQTNHIEEMESKYLWGDIEVPNIIPHICPTEYTKLVYDIDIIGGSCNAIVKNIEQYLNILTTENTNSNEYFQDVKNFTYDKYEVIINNSGEYDDNEIIFYDYIVKTENVENNEYIIDNNIPVLPLSDIDEEGNEIINIILFPTFEDILKHNIEKLKQNKDNIIGYRNFVDKILSNKSVYNINNENDIPFHILQDFWTQYCLRFFNEYGKFQYGSNLKFFSNFTNTDGSHDEIIVTLNTTQKINTEYEYESVYCDRYGYVFKQIDNELVIENENYVYDVKLCQLQDANNVLKSFNKVKNKNWYQYEDGTLCDENGYIYENDTQTDTPIYKEDIIFSSEEGWFLSPDGDICSSLGFKYKTQRYKKYQNNGEVYNYSHLIDNIYVYDEQFIVNETIQIIDTYSYITNFTEQQKYKVFKVGYDDALILDINNIENILTIESYGQLFLNAEATLYKIIIAHKDDLEKTKEIFLTFKDIEEDTSAHNTKILNDNTQLNTYLLKNNNIIGEFCELINIPHNKGVYSLKIERQKLSTINVQIPSKDDWIDYEIVNNFIYFNYNDNIFNYSRTSQIDIMVGNKCVNSIRFTQQPFNDYMIKKEYSYYEINSDEDEITIKIDVYGGSKDFDITTNSEIEYTINMHYHGIYYNSYYITFYLTPNKEYNNILNTVIISHKDNSMIETEIELLQLIDINLLSETILCDDVIILESSSKKTSFKINTFPYDDSTITCKSNLKWLQPIVHNHKIDLVYSENFFIQRIAKLTIINNEFPDIKKIVTVIQKGAK